MANRKKQNQNAAVSADMTVADIIAEYPGTIEVFLKYGFHCFGCFGASFETLKDGARVHGADLGKLLKDLKRAAKNKKLK